jgi:hypothetical protein
LFVTLGGRFLNMEDILPHWLYVAFIPNDKTNLDPSGIVHFLIVTFFIIRYVPRDWAGFDRPVFRPMILKVRFASVSFLPRSERTSMRATGDWSRPSNMSAG